MSKRIVTLVVLVSTLFLATQYRAISDWWVLQTYQPPPQIAEIAKVTTMTDGGKRHFYAATPEINDKATFGQNCPSAERSLVLGCYAGGEIYLLQVERPELAKVLEVTGAHEMLHAAYHRLSTKERQRVNNQIESFYSTVNDPKIKELVAEYERSEPGERLNELHSILPTQLEELSPELETYYKKYFTNRVTVARAYRSYEQVFVNIENQIKALKSELTTIESRISSLEAQADSASNRAQELSRRIDILRQQGQVEESNALVPAQNAAVNEARTAINLRNAQAEIYNQKVNQINSLALKQNELVNSLDSSRPTPL